MGRYGPVPLSPHLRLFATLLSAGTFYTTCAFGHGLELSGGIHTNFNGEHRDRFGNAPIVSVAYSAPIAPKDVHVLLELSYLSNSGQLTANRTFELPDGRYWVLPLIAGIRTNVISGQGPRSFALYLGFGVMTVFSEFEAPNGSRYTGTTFGGMAEMRPQLGLTDRLLVWVRERISVMDDVSYQPWATLNYSGAALQLGMSYGAP